MTEHAITIEIGGNELSRPRNSVRPFCLAFVALLAACTAQRSAHHLPDVPFPYSVDWIKQQIAEFEAGAVPDTNRIDGKVVFEGAPLYLIHSPCCDFYNYLYSRDGTALCAPSGGFAGRGDGQCPPGIGPAQRRVE